jgi:hypothetical protein
MTPLTSIPVGASRASALSTHCTLSIAAVSIPEPTYKQAPPPLDVGLFEL